MYCCHDYWLIKVNCYDIVMNGQGTLAMVASVNLWDQTLERVKGNEKKKKIGTPMFLPFVNTSFQLSLVGRR